ncbi:MAG: polyprenyl synthetase family protein [Planctomycetota bacterium]|nr:MAG: polyprenyl synthetase family protein [Planctomycetota bacterium]
MGSQEEFKEFFDFLKETNQKVSQYFENHSALSKFQPDEIKRAVLSYLQKPAKRLRPAVLLMSCGVVNGDLEKALPAAVSVELFHTWTLVHDDLIDQDPLRRGGPSVHKDIEDWAQKNLGFSSSISAKYGADISILGGDLQHGWSIQILVETARMNQIDPQVVLTLVEELDLNVLAHLIEGQALDVQFSHRNLESLFQLQEEDILRMLWLKTGALYEYCGRAGAMIGKNTCDYDDPQVQSLATFTSKCGIAFQLQDDLLGILGDEKKLGKQVGSDIREGKKTLIVFKALQNADSQEREKLLEILGNPNAKTNQVQEAVHLLENLGGIDYTRKLANQYIQDALGALEQLPAGRYRDLLKCWADFMISRNL